jgi:hypothetical protein
MDRRGETKKINKLHTNGKRIHLPAREPRSRA